MTWLHNAPPLFAIATGYFPEAQPDPITGIKNRPMLILGVRKHSVTGEIACRVAYGTTQGILTARKGDVAVGNLSDMNASGLQHPTRFATATGADMVILPWNTTYFRPWNGNASPVLGLLPAPQQARLRDHLPWLSDLPQF